MLTLYDLSSEPATLVHWFSDSGVHQKRWKASLRNSADLGGLGRAQEFAILSSPVMIILPGGCTLRATTSMTVMANFICQLD